MCVWEVGITSMWRIERGDAPGTIVVEDPVHPESARSSTAQAASWSTSPAIPISVPTGVHRRCQAARSPSAVKAWMPSGVPRPERLKGSGMLIR